MNNTLDDLILRTASTITRPFTARTVKERMFDSGYKRIPHSNRIGNVLAIHYRTTKTPSKTNIYHPQE